MGDGTGAGPVGDGVGSGAHPDEPCDTVGHGVGVGAGAEGDGIAAGRFGCCADLVAASVRRVT